MEKENSIIIDGIKHRFVEYRTNNISFYGEICTKCSLREKCREFSVCIGRLLFDNINSNSYHFEKEN